MRPGGVAVPSPSALHGPCSTGHLMGIQPPRWAPTPAETSWTVVAARLRARPRQDEEGPAVAHSPAPGLPKSGQGPNSRAQEGRTGWALL